MTRVSFENQLLFTKSMKRSWTYILECSDGSYYTGSTTALEARIAKHQAGFYGGYTESRRPLKLVWVQEFTRINDAIKAEWQIKGWTRKKKQALINGDFDLLHELAQSKEVRARRLKKKQKHAPP
jgi:predicted GIY-YIG superfamily endonuclease